jgi:hypothetical protein
MRFFAFISLFVIMLNASSSITIIPPQSKFDSSHSYFKGLLELILNCDVNYSTRMEQGRVFAELKQEKSIDLHWAGTSIEREEEFKAIRIPLIKGLLGYRVFLIEKSREKDFDAISNLEELKKLTPCQGTHWPDTLILESNGIKVIKNPNYESMFLQVIHGRCDYFPRGIHEAYSEMETRIDNYPKLMLYDKIMIYYPFPMYFFTSKNNLKLAKRIEDGLKKIIENGEFEEYIKNHETTKHLYPLNKWKDKTIYKLENPILPKDTDFKNPKYWISFE